VQTPYPEQERRRTGTRRFGPVRLPHRPRSTRGCTGRGEAEEYGGARRESDYPLRIVLFAESLQPTAPPAQRVAEQAGLATHLPPSEALTNLLHPSTLGPRPSDNLLAAELLAIEQMGDGSAALASPMALDQVRHVGLLLEAGLPDRDVVPPFSFDPRRSRVAAYSRRRYGYPSPAFRRPGLLSQ
jgi:hypothetical protein